jgi:hypothetical protein
MSEVKRYDLDAFGDSYIVETEWEDGMWVRAEDYDTLQANVERLEKQLEAIDETLNWEYTGFGRVNTVKALQAKVEKLEAERNEPVFCDHAPFRERIEKLEKVVEAGAAFLRRVDIHFDNRHTYDWKEQALFRKALATLEVEDE